MKEGNDRSSIRPGITVDVIRKEDQRNGKKTRGIVRDILTGSSFHPHGIKVRLNDGTVGRVAGIVEKKSPDEEKSDSI
jgi:uncharacterized repeat protein (TIGR03833 family)